jgi:hypothetical protein
VDHFYPTHKGRLYELFRQSKDSKIDLNLYYAWTSLGLVMWISWVDDCLVVGNREAVKKAKQQMKDHFDCGNDGNLKEYVGCKLDVNS